MDDEILGLEDDYLSPGRKSGATPPTHDNDFENVDLDTVEGINLQAPVDQITQLIAYLRNVESATYQRQDFDNRLDAAKEALQKLNYRKDDGVGYLKQEADVLAKQYDNIPLSMSRLTYGITLAITAAAAVCYVITGRYPEGFIWENLPHAQEIDFLALLITAGAVALFATGLGILRSQMSWYRHFTRSNSGYDRAKEIRLINHDVLVNKIKNLQQVSAADARNKDPDRGASGLLRVYLLFICGYVLHKTLNRCHTRFQQDFDSIWVPTVQARIVRQGSAMVVAGIAWLMILMFDLLPHGCSGANACEASNLFPVLFSFATALFLPLLTAWYVQRHMHRKALRKNGKVVGKVLELKGLYQTHIPLALLQKFKLTDNERPRFDFPDIYLYNDIEPYTDWLHRTLSDLKRHENETRK